MHYSGAVYGSRCNFYRAMLRRARYCNGKLSVCLYDTIR